MAFLWDSIKKMRVVEVYLNRSIWENIFFAIYLLQHLLSERYVHVTLCMYGVANCDFPAYKRHKRERSVSSK